MQICVMVGNLVADPVTMQRNVKGVQTSVTHFTLAINDARRPDAPATFVRCTAWRGAGETIQQYACKGRGMIVTGSVKASAYTRQDGSNAASLDLNVQDFQFLGKNPATQAAQMAAATTTAMATAAAAAEYDAVDNGADEAPWA